MFDFLEFGFNQRAVLAAGLIGFSNGALGALVVLRKNALVVSALSHALLPGIALGILIFGGLNPFVGFVGALVGALVVGLSTVYVARVALLDHQTSLSVLYTTAFAAGLLMLERIPTFTNLEGWLFGNILGLRNTDLWITYGVSMAILLSLTAWRRGWILYLFEPAVAASMGVPVRRMHYWLTLLMVIGLVTSLQAVGSVLSAALFITPTAIVLQLVRSPRALILGSGITGGLSGVVSIALSNALDLRPGAVMILVLGLLFPVALGLKRILEARGAPLPG
jgi:ABC-type Mn2+/Zn2+ transport system permease subunit